MEKLFFEGLKIGKPHDNAPGFVKGKVAIKVDELVAFLQKHQNEKGWLNADLKEGRNGGYYMEVDTWKPKKDTWNDTESSVDPETGREVDPTF